MEERLHPLPCWYVCCSRRSLWTYARPRLRPYRCRAWHICSDLVGSYGVVDSHARALRLPDESIGQDIWQAAYLCIRIDRPFHCVSLGELHFRVESFSNMHTRKRSILRLSGLLNYCNTDWLVACVSHIRRCYSSNFPSKRAGHVLC